VAVRRAAQVDANHALIRDGLRRAGVVVHDTHDQGGGFPDLVARGVGPKRDQVVLLEVKNPDQPASKRSLTVDEETFHGNWRGCQLFVVETIVEACEAVGLDVLPKGA
jgi:hypothetical protein